MKSVRPNLKICRVAAKYADEEKSFIETMEKLSLTCFVACNTILEDAIRDSDIIVTATNTSTVA